MKNWVYLRELECGQTSRIHNIILSWKVLKINLVSLNMENNFNNTVIKKYYT